MLEKIKTFLFYSNIDRKNYQLVRVKILEANRTTVVLISGCATVLITAMFVSTFFVEGVETNRAVYSVGMIMSFIVFLLGLTYAKEHDSLIMPLVYVACFIFYMYGILIGTVTDPGQKTVTFIAMLVFLPVLFTDTPIHQIGSTAIYITFFIVLCMFNKTGAVLQNDVLDAMAFGFLGLISGTGVGRAKIHGYNLEAKLKKFSETDELTQMNNRNLYEQSLKDIYDFSKHSLICIYLDVNGLHELNNTKGHEEGDEMLKFIAMQIKEFFGKEMTFRIGGDEFVIFAPDKEPEKIKKILGEMTKIIENAGYHLATGLENMEDQDLNMKEQWDQKMRELIANAESKMYKAKEQFYKNRTFDRRRN